MAYYLNHVAIIGNLTRDPELREFDGGGYICSFCVATNFEYTDRNTGERMKKTEFHDCTVTGEFARVCKEGLKKSAKVYVDGHIQTNSWIGKEDGLKKERKEIKAKQVIFLDKKKPIEVKPPLEVTPPPVDKNVF